jgi:formylglycine-generating enzyme required for sulfatase activity
MQRDSYTRYPRAILWLLRGGDLTVEAPGPAGGESITHAVGPFYIGKIPITNEQFEAFDSSYVRASSSPDADGPAVGISAEAAAEYCRWYAQVSRKPMRLPSEIEWEYACRGDTQSRYYFGEKPEQGDSHLWDARNSDGRVRDPRLKGTNPFGLHGMLGSVWEWTMSADGRHVLCGGSFKIDREQMGAGIRRPAEPAGSLDDVGFRIVRAF